MLQIDTLISQVADDIRAGDNRKITPSPIASKAYAAWIARAREKQIRPHAAHPIKAMQQDDWLVWMLDAGRGFGKTAAGAGETVRQSQDSAFIAIVADNFADGRDQCVEGESGLKALLGKDLRWNRSNGEMEFPSGAKGKIFSAEDPESLRGPNNYYAWCDELGKWRYQKEAWDQLMFTLRKGRAQCVITTTPRPSALTKRLKAHPRTVVTKGSTYENIANLADAFIESTIKPYEGTTLGRQELNAEDIDDVPGALWTRGMIDALRIQQMPAPDFFKRIVVAIDPAGTADSDSDETGIGAAGLGQDGHGYILADRSLRGSPNQWAMTSITAYHEFHADRLIAEVNNGGDMVINTIDTVAKAQGRSVATKKIVASRGKHTRAEPIAALYEQGRVHHVGAFPQLEDQMCTSLLDGNSHDDRCFPAGTMIATENGQRPIENIISGEMVLTRNGYKRVLNAGITSNSSRLLRLTLSCGIILDCTPNHPVYVHGKGFVPSCSIKKGDQVLALVSTLSSSTALNTVATQIVQANQQHATSIHLRMVAKLTKSLLCMLRYGSFITGMCLKAITSIIGIKDLTTIASQILRPSVAKIMAANIEAIAFSVSGSRWNMLDNLRLSGTKAKKDANGILNQIRKSGRIVNPMQSSPARNAEKNLLHSLAVGMWMSDSAHASASADTTNVQSDTMRIGRASSAEQNSQSRKVSRSQYAPVSVVGLFAVPNSAVYNLTVEDAHEYFANGVLVHNCDWLVWALTDLMLGSHGSGAVRTLE